MRRGEVVTLRERVHIVGVVHDEMTAKIERSDEMDGLTHVVETPTHAGLPTMVCGESSFHPYPAHTTIVTCMFCVARVRRRW